MGLFVGRAEGTSEEGTSDTCVGSELGENVTKGNGGIVGASDGFTVPSADVSEGAADSCVGNELTLGENETKGKGGSVEVNVGSRVPCAEGTADISGGSELGENVTKGNGGIAGAIVGFTVPSADVSEGAADSCVGNELTLGENETKGKGGSVEVNVGSRVPCAEGTADISGSSEGGQNIKHKGKGKGGYVEAEAGAGDDDGRDCSAVLGAADLVTSEAFVDETRHISKRINSMQTTLKLIL